MGGKYEINGTRLRCPVCAQEHFDYSHSIAELTGLPVRGKEKPGDRHVMLCRACGCGIWFPDRAATELEEVLECFECGTEIHKSEKQCKSCGWSYMVEGTE